MAKTKRKKEKESPVERVLRSLEPFARAHPQAKIDVRQPYEYAIRIRIIDPGFAKLSYVEREELVWHLLETLEDDVFTNLTTLLMLTPKEAKTSFANMEFDEPVESS